MPRGPCWSQHEVSRLLAQIKGTREVTLLMASTSRPNEALWKDIARRLSAEGYDRNVSQCRAKWKKLKQSFYSDWEARRQGGSQSLCSPLHYKIMKRLWKVAGRPVFGVRRLPDVGNREGSRERRKSWPEMDHLSLLSEEQDNHERGIRSERRMTWMEEHQNSLSQVHVYSLGMLQVKEEDDDDDEDEDEMRRPSSATMPWDMRSAVEQEGLSCPELSPVREAVNDLGGHRSPSSLERYGFRDDDAGTPSPPALHLAKSQPQSSTLSAGVPVVQTSSSPLSHTDLAFSHLLSMKQESREQLTEQEALPSVPLEETALEDQAAAVDLQGPMVVSLLQSMQQILAQLLHTSQQQQVLLESLASDTVSHLHVISDNLVHVGETLHELLIRVHNCDDIQ